MSSEFMWEALTCCFYGTGCVVLVAVSIAFAVGAYKTIASIDDKPIGDINIKAGEIDAKELSEAIRREIRQYKDRRGGKSDS